MIVKGGVADPDARNLEGLRKAEWRVVSVIVQWEQKQEQSFVAIDVEDLVVEHKFEGN